MVFSEKVLLKYSIKNLARLQCPVGQIQVSKPIPVVAINQMLDHT